MRRDPAKSDRDRLADMVAVIGKIERYAARGRQEFEEDELIQAWMVLQLLILGEAASGLSRELRERHTEVPWRRIIDMRNTMVHGYAYVDFEMVWGVVEQDVPRLRPQIARILAELE